MQTLYAIHINIQGQISLDVFSPRHNGPSKWRMYFSVRPHIIKALRRIYASRPKAFYIRREWSTGRWRAFKRWEERHVSREAGDGTFPSLDQFPTSGLAL